MSKLVEWFKKLNKNTQIIIGLVIAMLILWGLTSIMKSWLDNKSDWNYNTKTIDASVLSKSTVEYDRNVYWTLRNIIDTYTESYLYDVASNKDEITNKISYKEYYDWLDKGYKKTITKTGYEKRAKEFFSKVVIEDEFDYTIIPNTIEKINRYGNDMYLCTIKIDFLGADEIASGRGYIGIKLNSSKRTFSIFYLGGQYE